MDKMRKRVLLFIFFASSLFLLGGLFIANADAADPPECPGGAVISDADTPGNCGVQCREAGFIRPEWLDGGWKGGAKCCCKERRTTARTTTSGGSAGFENPLQRSGEPEDKWTNIPLIIGAMLRWVFGILGVFALVVFIYGGLVWMTSAGDEQRVTRGRETLVWAGLGIIVIVGSYVVVQFILNAVLR